MLKSLITLTIGLLLGLMIASSESRAYMSHHVQATIHSIKSVCK